MATHVIDCSEGNDEINVVAPAPGDSQIYNGLGGDDVFIVNAGVSQTTIYGTNGDGFDADRQWDTIQLLGSAQLDPIVGIDVLTFASTGPATTLTYNANSAFGVSQVVGSSSGSDTIHFTSGSEAVDLDISNVQFVNWSRPNQTIVVDLNTDTTVARDDRFVGSSVNERVTAGNGIDVLDGGDGNDTLIGGGGEGPNILIDGKGNDVYKFRDKVDIIIDSGGLDSRVVTKTTTLSSKEMFEGLAVDWDLSVRKSVNLTGTSKANVLIGHDGKNTLKGLAGNDILDGRGGNDQLNGDAGNDSLNGGLGNDVLNGGAGKDTFIFDTALGGANVDKIVGFQAKQDKIALDHDTFTALSVGRLASSAFSIGKAAKDAGNTIVYDSKTGALYYDADGSGAGAAIKFAQLDKNLKLSASDFLVI